MSGAAFLWLILQHVLPKRFRRAQCRIFASQPLASARTVAGRVEGDAWSGHGLDEAASAAALQVLRRTDADCATAVAAGRSRTGDANLAQGVNV